MARKTAPRWGYTSEWDRNDFERRWGATSYEALVEGLGFSASTPDSMHSELDLAIFEFHKIQFGEPSPTEREVTASLAEVKSAADKLALCLRDLDDVSVRRLSIGFEAAMQGVTDDDPMATIAQSVFGQRAEFASVIQRLGNAAELAPIHDEPQRRGRKGNPAVKRLIERFAQIYETNTGHAAFSGFRFNPIEESFGGPFFKVVFDFLTDFAPDLGLSNQAIGEHIRRAIGDRARP